MVEPFEFNNEKVDAVLASVAEYLCDELNIECPEWLLKVPACKVPWFISGMENLKAIAIVESPLHFRIRKIFVKEDAELIVFGGGRFFDSINRIIQRCFYDVPVSCLYDSRRKTA